MSHPLPLVPVLADVFAYNALYNDFIYVAVIAFTLLAAVLVVMTWLSFDANIDRGTMPSAARRQVWHRWLLSIGVCAALGVAAVSFRGAIGEKVMPGRVTANTGP